jgi:hypothetical protein
LILMMILKCDLVGSAYPPNSRPSMEALGTDLMHAVL